MINNKNKFIEEDLFYELRMLLGAARCTKFFEEEKIDNPQNFFKDSVYVHSRNLYNFFWGTAKNDASVYDYVIHVFNVGLYIKWKSPLHNHALHIKDSRIRPNNTINGIHINMIIQDFADDIERLWNEWIDVTSDEKTKELLIIKLSEARKQAEDDYNELKEKLKK